MSANLTPSPPFLAAYLQSLTGKAPSTVDIYSRVLHQLLAWLAERPDIDGPVLPQHLTRTAVETYLTHLNHQGYSLRYRIRVKAVISGLAHWLIDEHNGLRSNPTRSIVLPPIPILAPRQLTDDQRYVLRSLVEQANDLRAEALFALGYWAGCRVSDVSWLRMPDTHLTARDGWLCIGFKGGKTREIDLCRQARLPLLAYIQHQPNPDRPYVFVSQRSERLTEAGIHHWFRTLKARASKAAWELIHDVTFHDLRHDFAHRVRAAGWTLEDIAYYLGHITRQGTPAIQTTARYTQVSRAQIRDKITKLTDG